jgi:hypothetical protein
MREGQEIRRQREDAERSSAGGALLAEGVEESKSAVAPAAEVSGVAFYSAQFVGLWYFAVLCI